MWHAGTTGRRECDHRVVRRLLVVDFANIAHRAYFAGRGRPAHAPDGRPVFLVATFLRFVLARIREDGATHVALAFESTTGSRRRESDPAYKPRRAQEPDDLLPQLRDANIAAGRLGWARYRAQGWEADDAMAGIADAAVVAGFDEVLLHTGDHDLLGVVSDRVAVLMPRAGGGVDRYGPVEVEERSPYRVPPALVADVKALIGDFDRRLRRRARHRTCRRTGPRAPLRFPVRALRPAGRGGGHGRSEPVARRA